METILTAVGFMAVLGLILASVLVVANKRLYVFEDPRIDQVEELLPKANCGACGTAGCRQFAEKLVQGEIEPGKCTVNTKEMNQVIADFLGVDLGAGEKRVARLACAGGIHVAYIRASYGGVQSCRGAALVSGGGKGCSWGCLGLGDCAEVCEFDAIHLDKHGLPVVSEDKCTACGDCVTVCPNRAIFTYRSQERLLDLPLLQWQGRKLSIVGRERFELRQAYQVAVLADLCNDCGNCTTFCPTSGRPFADKPRLFVDGGSFRAHSDNAFHLVRRDGGWLVQAVLAGVQHELAIADTLRYRTGGVELSLAADTLEVLASRLTGEPPPAPFSLRSCATMLALFHGVRESLPWIPVAVTEPAG